MESLFIQLLYKYQLKKNCDWFCGPGSQIENKACVIFRVLNSWNIGVNARAVNAIWERNQSYLYVCENIQM